MFGISLQKFLQDEAGGYTIWSLIWFVLYLAIGGLTVDVTDAYRNQTMLQATADASALAGALSLPNEADATAQALSYSTDNMNAAVNGNVLRANEVFAGTWDFTARTFTVGGVAPNAIRVITRRDSGNGNPLAQNFLRILALVGHNPLWNINVEAIAVKYIPSCIDDGFVAQVRVFYRANNNFYNDICIHGQDGGVALRGPNNYHQPGVRVSMSDLDDLDAPGPAYGTVEDALVEGDLWPKDISTLDARIEGLRTGDPNFVPDYMYVDVDGNPVTPQVVQKNSNYTGPFDENKIYDIHCSGQLNLGQGAVISRTVIVADCRIHSASDMSAGNVVLASTHSAGGSDAIHMAAKSNLGIADNCAPGGGVEIYTPGDVHMAAQGEWHGLRIVSGNDVKFTANNDGVWGIAVQAGNNIDFTSNNNFGLCIGGNPGDPAWQYRLVH
ncbi:MAG TPA: pilus assembly protein TadG-related protein [Thermohalobaculum sp.]|nr:pilus assembly protein TadG-related protein [Thermohalobaculum sp.]